MKLSLSRDTLAYQLGVRPALQFRDMTKAPLVKVVSALNEFKELNNAYEWIDASSGKKEPAQGDPHKDGVIFYMLNHAVSTIRKKVHPLEPLGKYMPLLDLYHEQVALRGTRMFYYLLAICARESRHAGGAKAGQEKALRAKYSDLVVDFHGHISDVGEGQAMELFLSKPPDVPLGLWLGFMAEHFRKYVYSKAFGGEKWGKIADVVQDFAAGKISLEMMLDTSFTLNHNTSPIFNKPILYSHYTHDLLKLLDVQNSGQIPQLINEKGIKAAHETDVQTMFAICRKTLEGTDFLSKNYVDWYKVEADYAALSEEKKGDHVASYPMEKKTQAAMHGVPNDTKAKATVAEVKADMKVKAEEQEAIAMVQIFPGQYIKKVARVKINYE